jgi:hypothetical protein
MYRDLVNATIELAPWGITPIPLSRPLDTGLGAPLGGAKGSY